MKNIFLKKITLLFICISVGIATLPCIFANAETAEYSVSDGQYVRHLGRGQLLADNSYTFNWPNAGLEFEFTGTKAELNASKVLCGDAPFNSVYFNIYIDDGAPVRVALVQGWNKLYEGTETETHKIKFVRSSEACRGTCSFDKIRVDGSEPVPTTEKEKRIEFIGDSYTAGYGNVPEQSTSTSYCAQNTDNWYSYTNVTAQHYNADSTVIAYQGKGVCYNRSTQDTNGNMSEQFGYSDILTGPSYNMSTKSPWNFKKYRPQVVTVFLGTNDAAANGDTQAIKNKFIELFTNIRMNYPKASVIVISKQSSCCSEQADEACSALGGEKNKFYRLILQKFSASSMGHPNADEHKSIANELIAKIDSIPGIWDVTDDDIDENSSVTINADYNTNVVTVNGSTESDYDEVSVLILKPGKNNLTYKNEDISYVDQVTTDESGYYEIDFSVDAIAGDLTLYVNSLKTASMQMKAFSFKSFIPTLTVNKGSEALFNVSQLSAGDKISANIGGYSVTDEKFEGVAIIAQYKEGVLVNVAANDASTDTTSFGSDISFEAEYKSGVDLIKVMYIDNLSLRPLVGVYKIQ